ncbi:hypothetical protein V8C34DRAFT_250022 [Trichoderma compactum]
MDGLEMDGWMDEMMDARMMDGWMDRDATAEMMQPPNKQQRQQKQQQPQQQAAINHTPLPLCSNTIETNRIIRAVPLDGLGLKLTMDKTSRQPSLPPSLPQMLQSKASWKSINLQAGSNGGCQVHQVDYAISHSASEGASIGRLLLQPHIMDAARPNATATGPDNSLTVWPSSGPFVPSQPLPLSTRDCSNGKQGWGQTLHN